MATQIGTAAQIEAPARPLQASSPNITKRKAAAVPLQEPARKRCD